LLRRVRERNGRRSPTTSSEAFAGGLADDLADAEVAGAGDTEGVARGCDVAGRDYQTVALRSRTPVRKIHGMRGSLEGV
jgi:hypothetical protein